jgi:CRISPR-associated endonuclease/helicase Cas3
MTSSYANYFMEQTGGKKKPHQYQETVAAEMLKNRHLVVRAPTGAGKTLAVLIPFLLFREQLGVAALIYVLPLRTLVEAVAAEAQYIAAKAGLKVAVQTGERADAEFFHDADIIVTTFDQLLSGLLCDPYGLSKKLWNINAAAIAGKMVVFDEFHLMEPDRAFVSALFGVGMFKDLCISVWMTATATSSLVNLVCKTLGAKEIGLSSTELLKLFEGRGIRRAIETRWGEMLTAEQVLLHKGKKVLVVVNTVARAQSLYEKLLPEWQGLLLHSRFFSADRRAKQANLENWDLVISTQVIEAGVDISCAVLLTEAAPVNSLVQRSGRCARFPEQTGSILVFDTPLPHPYTPDQINAAKRIVENTASANPETCSRWVESAHAEDDRRALTGFNEQVRKRRKLIESKVTGEGDLSAAAYIRTGDDSVRLFILANPEGIQPREREAIQVRRATLRQYRSGAWVFDGDDWIKNGDVDAAYAIALSPVVANYTREVGLRLGSEGTIESPSKESRKRPGWPPISAEPWSDHTKNVIQCGLDRLAKEGLYDALNPLVEWTAKLHDLGKLQSCWQAWALDRQAQRGKISERALAHTDYDWKLKRGEKPPPHHASASAILGFPYLADLSENDRTATLLAVLAHHGGKLKGLERADILHSNARLALIDCGLNPTQPTDHIQFKLNLSESFVDAFDNVWPITAILSRILRLSDQQATSESSNEQS